MVFDKIILTIFMLMIMDFLYTYQKIKDNLRLEFLRMVKNLNSSKNYTL